MTSNPAKKSILLRLPPEIRNEIYRLLLARSHRIPICLPQPKPFPSFPSFPFPSPSSPLPIPPNSSAPLLELNKQIHAETLAVFFHHNTFSLPSTSQLSLRALAVFTAAIPPALRAEIRSMHIRLRLCRAYTATLSLRDVEPALLYRPHRWDPRANARLPGLYLGTETDVRGVKEACAALWRDVPGLRELVVHAVFDADEVGDRFLAPEVESARAATVHALVGLLGGVRASTGVAKVRFCSTVVGDRWDGERARESFLDALVEWVMPVVERGEVGAGAGAEKGRAVVWRKELSWDVKRFWRRDTDPEPFEVVVEFGE